MANQSSIRKNIGLQTAYQILNTCLPLITAPYLSRVLGAANIGVFSYTSSVVAYFTLFSMLGTVNYGSRSIAATKDNRAELSHTFWSIFHLKALSSVICLIGYCVYLGVFCRENKDIATIQALAIINSFLNISWLYFGLEQFQKTVLYSFVIRLLTVASILFFVNSSGDLWLYTLIMLGGTLLSDLLLWIHLPKFVDRAKVSFKDCIQHIKPNCMLFIPLLAMSVYHTMDKTMLGMLSTYQESGYYYNADKVVNITVGIISGISTVMLPRMTSLISGGKNDEADELFKLSLEGTVFAGTAMAFGIAAIANEFEPLFFGPGYEACIVLTIVLAPVLIIKSFAFTARYQYLIPHKREKDYIASVICGAIINLVANTALIPKYGAMGAVIGTLLAELGACCWQFISIRQTINMDRTLIRCLVYLIFGAIMFVLVRFTAKLEIVVIIKIILEIFVGIVTYCALCFCYWHISRNNIPDVVFGSLLARLQNKK